MNRQVDYQILYIDDEKVLDLNFDKEKGVVKVKLGSDIIQEIDISYIQLFEIFKGVIVGDIYS